MKKKLFCGAALAALVHLHTPMALAWDYEGHRVVNQLALTALPADFPSFVKKHEAAERIAFLAGEPDRWRNVQDLPLKHCNGPDHYIDIEQLHQYGLKPELLPILRGQFIAELALARNAHPEKFPNFNTPANADHTRELVGLLPWAIAENYSKLKSCFSYLKTFEAEGGTAEEIANAQADAIYVMGILGHFVGDASQPLHTTIHHHGWVGDNPNHYTTDPHFHSRIDGFLKMGDPVDLKALSANLHPAQVPTLHDRPAGAQEIFRLAVAFVMDQNKLVEPLYQLEKESKLPGDGDKGGEGRQFLENQLVKSGQLLADTWYSAWQEAPPDTFLTAQLARRKHAEANADVK